MTTQSGLRRRSRELGSVARAAARRLCWEPRPAPPSEGDRRRPLDRRRFIRRAVRRVVLTLAALGLLATSGGFAATSPPAIVFGAPVYLPGADRGRCVVIADVTGDGRNDVVIAGYEDATVAVYPGTGEGLFAVSSAVTTSHAHATRMIAGDLNHDGVADLVVNTGEATSIDVLLSNGSSGLVRSTYPAADGDVVAAGAGAVGTNDEFPTLMDWNNDGSLDVVTGGYTAGLTGVVRVRLNDGAGHFGASVIVFTPGGQPDVCAADLDGDGLTDLYVGDHGKTSQVYWRETSGWTTSSSYHYDANHTFTNDSMEYGASDGIFALGEWVSAADLDGDGTLDLVGLMYPANGSAPMPGAARHHAPHTRTIGVWTSGGAAGSKPWGVAVADLNGDQRPDMITARAMYLNLGDGYFGPHGRGGWTVTGTPLPATGTYGVAAGDLDGDGVPDIVTTYDQNVGGTVAAVVLPVEHAATHIGLASITPSTLHLGATLDVVITGAGFKAGDVVDFGAGITVNSVTAESATSLRVNVTVQAFATTGFRNVKVTHPDGGHGKLWSAVVVAESGAATIGGVVPDHGHAGDTLNIDVYGYGFTQGSIATMGAGVAVNSVSVLDVRHSRINVTLAPDATLGLRDLAWTNGTGVLWTAKSAFTVLRRRSVDLSLVQGRITTKKKPGRGTFTAAGGLAFNQASADGLFDPVKDAVQVRFGNALAPSVVDVPLGGPWRIRGGRFTWKTAKRAPGPRVALTIDLARHGFSFSVARLDVSPDALDDVSFELTLGADYGVTTRHFVRAHRRVLVLK